MPTPVHLNALRAFEASARHQSFSLAATELHVSPAAVGQLVRTLEDWLGQPLFVRASSGTQRLQLTATAQAALGDIQAGFARLAAGVQQLQQGVGNEVLTLTVSPAFAAKWLLPRIERFQQAWPQFDLHLDTSLKPVDLTLQRMDAGIRYGTGHWPGLQAELLMQEQVFPVCSPRLLATTDLTGRVDALLQQTLLHDLSMDSQSGFPNWQRWLAAAGIKTALQPAMSRGLQINNSAAVLQAAIDGHGIALARSVLVHDDVASGRLVRLWPAIGYQSELAYYLVCPPAALELARVQALRQWLLQEVAAPA